jgi:tetratricopeptide (TPR) repeat protein
MTTAHLAPSRPSPWFHSPTFDLLLVLAVPFATWPLVMAGQTSLGAPLLNQLILLSATGHYFATFVRTYGDRELFARWRTRFVVAPFALLILCITMFATGQQAALMLATTGWAFWHWLAQAFGFARIYDSKVGSFRPLTAWLDKALVTMGFTGAVVLNPASTATFGKVFLDAGVPLPSAEVWVVVQQVVLWACGATGVAYLANLGAAIFRGQPWSWQKQFMHATTIGYYWFAFAWVPNVLVAYVLYELFHDIQYYAITWLACRHRVQRPGVAPWFARMFRPGFFAAILFVLAMYALGGLDAFGRANLEPNGAGHSLWLAVFLTAALLHYYYDGFVWKARESAIGKDLGLPGGLRAAVVPTARHAALWSLFLLPIAANLLLAGPVPSPRQRAAALVAVAPGDFLSQAELAFELTRAGELPAAIAHYRASIAANPDFAQARANFGAALDLHGDLDGAREQYEAALRCEDRDGAHRQAHGNLGVLLLARGERKAAQEHLQKAQQMGGEHPIGRLLGLAAAVPTDAVARRTQLYEAALQLDPNQLDAHYNLGLILAAQGTPTKAAEHLAVVARLAPDFVPGLVASAKVQWELGKMDEARNLVQRALQREPNHAEAKALQAKLPGR